MVMMVLRGQEILQVENCTFLGVTTVSPSKWEVNVTIALEKAPQRLELFTTAGKSFPYHVIHRRV